MSKQSSPNPLRAASIHASLSSSRAPRSHLALNRTQKISSPTRLALQAFFSRRHRLRPDTAILPVHRSGDPAPSARLRRSYDPAAVPENPTPSFPQSQPAQPNASSCFDSTPSMVEVSAPQPNLPNPPSSISCANVHLDLDLDVSADVSAASDKLDSQALQEENARLRVQILELNQRLSPSHASAASSAASALPAASAPDPSHSPSAPPHMDTLEPSPVPVPPPAPSATTAAAVRHLRPPLPNTNTENPSFLIGRVSRDETFDRDDEIHRLRRETRQLRASLLEVGKENERLCTSMGELRVKGLERVRELEGEREELEERLITARDTCQQLEGTLCQLREWSVSNIDRKDQLIQTLRRDYEVNRSEVIHLNKLISQLKRQSSINNQGPSNSRVESPGVSSNPTIDPDIQDRYLLMEEADESGTDSMSLENECHSIQHPPESPPFTSIPEENNASGARTFSSVTNGGSTIELQGGINVPPILRSDGSSGKPEIEDAYLAHHGKSFDILNVKKDSHSLILDQDEIEVSRNGSDEDSSKQMSATDDAVRRKVVGRWSDNGQWMDNAVGGLGDFLDDEDIASSHVRRLTSDDNMNLRKSLSDRGIRFDLNERGRVEFTSRRGTKMEVVKRTSLDGSRDIRRPSFCSAVPSDSILEDTEKNAASSTPVGRGLSRRKPSLPDSPFMRTSLSPTASDLGDFSRSNDRLSETEKSGKDSSKSDSRDLKNPLMNIGRERIVVGQFCRHAVETVHKLLTGRADAAEKEAELKRLLEREWAQWLSSGGSKLVLVRKVEKWIRKCCRDGERVDIVGSFNAWYARQYSIYRERTAAGAAIISRSVLVSEEVEQSEISQPFEDIERSSGVFHLQEGSNGESFGLNSGQVLPIDA